MKRKPLEKRVYRLHLDIIKELNNSHIFLQKAIPIIKTEIKELKNSQKNNKDRTYQVPTKKGKRTSSEAYRTDLEVKDVLNKLVNRELFENILVTNLSKFESFMFDVIKETIVEYPNKLTLTVQGIKAFKTIPVEFVLKNENYSQILDSAIHERINEVAYSKPETYINYFGEVTGCNVKEDVFNDFIELKATRDLIIHNSGKVNQVYLEKVKSKKRGEIGHQIKIDNHYFDESIAVMKRISGIIRRDFDKNYKKENDVEQSA